MHKCDWLLLQLFAGEGAGGTGGTGGATSAGGNEGAATGENAVDAGQQRLRELGVPEDKIRKRANKRPWMSQRATADAPVRQNQQPSTQQVAAASESPTEENTDTPRNEDQQKEDQQKVSLKEMLKAHPELNTEVQTMIQGRLRNAKAAQETLSVMTPAIEVLARKYNQDPANPDYAALAKAIENDNGYYEDKAIEMGTPVENAKTADIAERAAARQQREQARTLEQKMLDDHTASVIRQADELKKIFPKFDLQKEMQDPRFVRMTAPNSGLSVEDAFFAIHRKEIQAASAQVAAQKTAQQISDSIQAGMHRPAPIGNSSKAPSVTTFDITNASKEQREALRQRIHREGKVYPGSL